MSWNDLTKAQNSNQHIIDVFNNTNVVTLENLTTDVKEINTKKETDYKVYITLVSEIVNIEGEPYNHLEKMDLNANIVFFSTKNANKIDLRHLNNGLYILKIYNNHYTFQQKLMVNK